MPVCVSSAEIFLYPKVVSYRSRRNGVWRLGRVVTCLPLRITAKYTITHRFSLWLLEDITSIVHFYAHCFPHHEKKKNPRYCMRAPVFIHTHGLTFTGFSFVPKLFFCHFPSTWCLRLVPVGYLGGKWYHGAARRSCWWA